MAHSAAHAASQHRLSGTRLPALVGLPLTLLFWVLPFHSLGIAYFFGVLHISMSAATILASWKEGIALLLVTFVIVRSSFGAGPRARVVASDIAVTGLLALAVIFATSENYVFSAGIPAGVELFGFRSTAFFMLLYYVGRGTPELASASIALRHAFYVALVVSAIGVLERMFVTPQMLVALGAAAYMNDFLGLTASTAGNDFGLPSNYFSTMGGMSVQRAGSVFLGGQAFALPFLLLIPAATAWMFGGNARPSARKGLAYAVIWAGLLLTITRVTIVVCVFQVLFYFLITRRLSKAVISVIVILTLSVLAVALLAPLRNFAWETATFQTASSYSHVFDWRRGVVAFLEQPWGHGLGSSDQVATRFGREALAADNMFLGYAVDLGLLGLIGHIAVMATIARASWRLLRTSTDPDHKNLAVTIFLAASGIAFNASSSTPFNSVFLAYNFFLLAGVSVTVLQRVRSNAVTPAPT